MNGDSTTPDPSTQQPPPSGAPPGGMPFSLDPQLLANIQRIARPIDPNSFSGWAQSPVTGALLGLTAGFGQAAMPTPYRMPFGAVLGMGASGMQQGMANAYRSQLSQAQAQQAQMSNAMTAAQMPATLMQSSARAAMLQQALTDPEGFARRYGIGGITGGGVGTGVTPVTPPGGGAIQFTGDKTKDLPLIAQHESGGNPTLLNTVAQEDPTAYARGATASGKYQMTNSTWTQGAQWAGVDTTKYPTARDAPEQVQDQVASAVYDHRGTAPWDASKWSNNWVKDPQTGRYSLQTTPPPGQATAAPPTGTTAAPTPQATNLPVPPVPSSGALPSTPFGLGAFTGRSNIPGAAPAMPPGSVAGVTPNLRPGFQVAGPTTAPPAGTNLTTPAPMPNTGADVNAIIAGMNRAQPGGGTQVAGPPMAPAGAFGNAAFGTVPPAATPPATPAPTPAPTPTPPVPTPATPPPAPAPSPAATTGPASLALPPGAITPQAALAQAAQLNRAAQMGDLLGMPLFGDPATLRAQAQTMLKYGLAPSEAAYKAAVEAQTKLQYAGPTAAATAAGSLPYDLVKQGWQLDAKGNMQPIQGGPNDPAYIGQKAAADAAAKAQVQLLTARQLEIQKSLGSNVEVRQNGMVGVIQPDGSRTWYKNPGIVDAQLPDGSTMPMHVAPAAPDAPPGTQGQAAPILGPNGQPIITKLPAQQTAGREEAVKDFQGKETDAYGAAQNTQAWLNQIDTAANRLQAAGPGYATGPFANERLSAANSINDLARTVGITPPFNQDALGSFEEMRKATTTAGFELASHYEGHARQAAATIMNATTAVPGVSNSPQGLRIVSAGIREGAQNSIELHEFKQQVYDATGGAGLESAETAYYKAHPAQQYADRAISVTQPFKINGPDDFQKYLPGTYVQTPQINPATGKPKIIQVPARTEQIKVGNDTFSNDLAIPRYLQGAPFKE